MKLTHKNIKLIISDDKSTNSRVLKTLEEQVKKEISEKLNISRSYVSRIEKRALLKIYKKFLKNNKEY